MLEELESAPRSANTYAKAYIAIKEIGDHSHYANLNFQLFTQMLLKGDFYGLKVSLPFLFLDLHIQLEQCIKLKLILETGQYPKTHSLAQLSCKAALQDHPLFHELNFALIHARYPVASRDHYLIAPKELEWILFSLNPR